MSSYYPNQRLVNTMYDQKQLENDPVFGINSNSPPNEYLTKILNNFFLPFLPKNEKSCLFNGLEIDVLSIDNENKTVNFIIRPGYCVLNYKLVIQKESYQFNISFDFLKDKLTNNIQYLILALNAEELENHYEIIPFFINNESNIFNEDEIEWSDTFFPIKVFGVEKILYDIFNTTYPPNSKFELNRNEIIEYNKYDLILSMYNIPNITYYYDNDINLKSILHSHSFPYTYLINNIEYVIPQYSTIELNYYKFIQEYYMQNSQQIKLSYVQEKTWHK